jgi:hypothetical protein
MASAWDRSLALLRAPGNEIAFALRRHLRWSRGAATLPTESKQGLFAGCGAEPAAAARERELRRRYDLTALAARSTRAVYRRNLALLDRLEALAAGERLPTAADGGLTAVDIGAGDFHYATALQRWLAAAAGEPGRPAAVRLRGVELDGHGIYRDGHARADHACAHAALAGPGVSYEVADFLRLTVAPVDVALLIHPFLGAYPLLRWGLPLSRLRPRRLLRHAVATVRSGGVLVVVNQTEAEFERLQRLLADQPVALRRRVAFAERLSPEPERTADRVGSWWQRV